MYFSKSYMNMMVKGEIANMRKYRKSTGLDKNFNL